MQCEKCRGTGLDPATTPAMNVKCEHCVGGKVIAKRQNVAVEEYIEDEKGDIKPVYVIRSNKKGETNMSCDKCDCNTVTEKKVKNVHELLTKDVKGVWLNTGNKEESVHVYVWPNGAVIAYNSPDLTKLGASKMALSLRKDNCEFQFFTEDKLGDVKIVNVDADLVYRKLYELLKDFEAKALDKVRDEIK